MQLARKQFRQMRTLARHCRHAATGVALILLTACTSSKSSGVTPSQPPPSTAPADKGDSKAGQKTYDDPNAHFRVQYPGNWKTQQDPDYVLAIVPPDMKTEDRTRRVTADFPDVPPHPPGLMTMHAVKDGYIKDVKKILANAKVTEDSAQKVAGSKAQRVVMTGKLKGQPRTMAAMLLIHSERVYIIRADTDTEHYSQMKPVWEQMVASLQWTN
jgi:hypothetical protein